MDAASVVGLVSDGLPELGDAPGESSDRSLIERVRSICIDRSSMTRSVAFYPSVTLVFSCRRVKTSGEAVGLLHGTSGL
jgi:hypothetical protein